MIEQLELQHYGMPDNSIIDEAVALYEAETDFLMGES